MAWNANQFEAYHGYAPEETYAPQALGESQLSLNLQPHSLSLVHCWRKIAIALKMAETGVLSVTA